MSNRGFRIFMVEDEVRRIRNETAREDALIRRLLNPAKYRAIWRTRDMRRRLRKIGAANISTASSSEIAALRESQTACAYCGCDLANGAHVDHIVPISRGGSDAIDNLTMACPRCNLRKRSLTGEEFMEVINGE